MTMPELLSFTVFDGIPPQEEGKDPVIFYYWSQKHMTQDAQYNEIGLFLTFRGFCQDFRASKDCEYFQTETGLTCFSDLGADCAVAATFDLTKPNTIKSPRVLVASVHRFAAAYRASFPTPTRIGPTTIDEKTDAVFKYFLVNFQKMFQYRPFLYRFPPSSELWALCEKTLVAAKQQCLPVRSGAFLYGGKVVHSSVAPSDLVSLYLCIETRPHDYWGDGLSFASTDEPRWLTGPVKDSSGNVNSLLPMMFLADGPGYPIVLSQGNLVAIFVFSETSGLSVDQVEPLRAAVAEFLPEIAGTCATASKSQEGRKCEFYRDDGTLLLSKPIELPQGSLLAARERVENLVDFLDWQGDGFVRFTGQLGQPSHWIFLEKDGRTATAVSYEEAGVKKLADVAAESVQTLRDVLLG
jgi:hypothetical protein